MPKTKLICTDLDGTFIGEDSSMYELLRRLEGEDIVLVFDTGRHLPSVMSFVQEKDIRVPDASICMVGTEVFLLNGGTLTLDDDWSDVISEDWDRGRIVDLLKSVPELRLQDDEWQTKFKASYFLRDNVEEVLEKVDGLMRGARLRATTIYSAGAFLDFLPVNSGKAKATGYLASKFDIQKEDVIVAGDSRVPLRVVTDVEQHVRGGRRDPDAVEESARAGPLLVHVDRLAR